MNWKLKLEEKGITVTEHLNPKGEKIGWFNFKHPKGYWCLAQNGTFSAVNSTSSWSSDNSYVTTNFDYFFENIEIFVDGTFENFKTKIGNKIAEFTNTEKFPFNREIASEVLAFETKEDQLKKLIEILVEKYNKNNATSHKWI
jgi:hypothetical protein